MELLAITTNRSYSDLLQDLKTLQVKYFYLLTRSPAKSKNTSYLLVLDDNTGFSAQTITPALTDLFKSRPNYNFIVTSVKVADYTDRTLFIKVNSSNWEATRDLLLNSYLNKFLNLLISNEDQLCFSLNEETSPQLRAKIVEAITWFAYPDSDQYIQLTRHQNGPILVGTKKPKSESIPTYLLAQENE